jgi:hypothetical protein
MSKSKIIIPREVLLVEIERRCAQPECKARTRIGLTKDEARRYTGFECEGCAHWNDDTLAERDVPDWWEELAVTGLHAIRAGRAPETPEEPGEVVTRMSDNYRSIRRDEG